jgi:murein DD-endopeptidase MepM/ murein hydrolase activator NlpD
LKVRNGQKVKRGDVIGLVGNSGLSAGPHLHYEVHKGGRPWIQRTIISTTSRPLNTRACWSFRGTPGNRWIDRYIARAPFAMPYKEKTIEKLYWSIGEVAEQLGVNTSLIRYWEKEFGTLRPKRTGKGDRLVHQEGHRAIAAHPAPGEGEGLHIARCA